MLHGTPVTPDSIARAAEALLAGQLVILPTDTVYGVVADVRRDDAVTSIYSAKGKGPEAPLQLLFGPSITDIEHYGMLTTAARRLVDTLGPGGWTIIVPAREDWQSPALAGGRTVGFRIPDAPTVHAVVDALAAPLAASSANRHGDASPTTCDQAVASLGDSVAIALDSGPTPAAIDSTVIDLSDESQPRILREGAIDRVTVARILGLPHIPVLRSVRP